LAFPYIDLAGLMRRSILRPSYFTGTGGVETVTPGFTVQNIATHTSYINSRLRKRYGGQLPWGQQAPSLVPAGGTPEVPSPNVTLMGRPVLGSFQTIIQITTAGALGTALFRWSSDGGITFPVGQENVATALQVQLGTTGMFANFVGSMGNYTTAYSYAAATAVPETLLRWLTLMVSLDVWKRHGTNTADPQFSALADDVKVAKAELEEAANSNTGLWDLPVSEDQGSAIDTGGPFGFSDSSPYAWTDRQVVLGTRQDAQDGYGGCGPYAPNRSWVPPR
jgi:hypothetical protein